MRGKVCSYFTVYCKLTKIYPHPLYFTLLSV